MRKLLIILGIPIDDLNMEQTLERLERFVELGRATGKVHQVATVNTDFVVKSLGDPELRYLLQEADMSTADGMPLVWGARFLGVPLEGRVTGADLVPALAERAAQKGYSIYFLGAAPGVAARAAAVLQERYPSLRVAGICSPPYRPVLEMDPAIIQEIKAARPDILYVAFGNPKQEKWIGMYGRETGVPVMIGVGGSLDFIAGKTRRAPLWMQRMGLEWLYRVLLDPGRLWRRYVEDLFKFGLFFLRQWWLMRGHAAPSPVLPTTDVVLLEGTAILHVQGRIDVSSVQDFQKEAGRALEETPFLIISLEKVDFLDSSAVGALVGLAKQAHDAGGKLWLVAIPPSIYQTLRLLRLDRYFSISEDIDGALAMRRKRGQPPTSVVRQLSSWKIYQTPRRLDASTTPQMTQECIHILAENPRLVLDLSSSDFLASAGLAALVQLKRQAEQNGGNVRLAGCSADIARVIKLVHFDRLFNLYTDVQAAIRPDALNGHRS